MNASLAITLTACLSSLGFLTDIYVDQSNPNCAGANGTQAAPYCTISAALAVAAHGDTIRVAPGTYHENLFWGNVDVALIGTAGAGATIVDGGQAGRVANCGLGTVSIEGLTLRNGLADRGAGVLSEGNLTLSDSIVSDNTALVVAPSGGGAGIWAKGTLTITNTAIRGNTAQHVAGNDVRGGGIRTQSCAASMSGCVIEQNSLTNQSGSGYLVATGIYAASGSLTLDRCRLSDNHGTGSAGVLGWGALYATALDPLVVNNCTVNGNTLPSSIAGGGAAGVNIAYCNAVISHTTVSVNSGRVVGGVFAWSLDDGFGGGTTCTFRNSTFSDNDGAGLYLGGDSPFAFDVLNCTVTGNSLNYSGGAYQLAAGVVDVTTNTLTRLRNTIVAGNGGSGGAVANDFLGIVDSLGHNLIGDGTSSSGFSSALGDALGSSTTPLDAQLLPLADNGGPTLTHAPAASSPAVDAGDPAVFEPTDQRGFARPGGTASDIGAVERDAVPVTTYCTPGTTTNGCSASISASGFPSASAGSGFSISVNATEGQSMGLMFYGVSGPKAKLWAPGSTSYLCVKGPLQRMSPQLTGGTSGACDGLISQDFNLYLASQPWSVGQPFLGGESVWVQSWFRDPPAPKGINMSNAMTFVLAP